MHTHTHARTRTHAHAKSTISITQAPGHGPTPALTFAAECCIGCLFMLRGLLMRKSSAGGCITLFIRATQWHYPSMSRSTLLSPLTSVFLLSFSQQTPPCVSHSTPLLLAAPSSPFLFFFSFFFSSSPTHAHQPSGHL